MDIFSLSIFLPNEYETIRFGKYLAHRLNPRDCLTLSGDIGAGKSVLARAIIRILSENDILEVLSPTFTLIQIYDAKIPIAHCDFYRLSTQQEYIELGLDEILNEGICIIEWPEIIRDFLPCFSISIHIKEENNGRNLIISSKYFIMKRIFPSLNYRISK
ncbi:ATPase YjeE [Liberibacter crescens BT-1]|uniref:tRNA threonylcarbamoyladenosine biosynthesis protein TsaE n=1 Tax=Liberibacter crescens (strain BT-1) TaxID=1215343 RepID=L0EUY4_LIBCB|nr:tRNA (adenosine(37)-N6)-threonylcarbamoyltransferase complex ATPase subunit type 1 TsaE [Liberibacter crescens]AGA65354.1 ATPase YjeE [Liberibacter crescens BT-1]